MNGLVNFIADTKVHDTILITMVITSFLTALPKPKPDPTTPWAIGYKFVYDWLVGFWSMKTGQPLPGLHIESKTETPSSLTTKETTLTENPIPPETPAKP